MKKTVLLLLLALPCLLAAQRSGRDYALLFTAYRYDDAAAWPPLNAVPTEITQLERSLRDLYGFDVKVVNNASREDIINTLTTWSDKKRYDNDSQLLLFFSMHGQRSTQEKGYLIPRDGGASVSSGKWLSHADLSDMVDAIPCPRILVSIDACFSGTFGPNRAIPGGADWEIAGLDCSVKRSLALKNKYPARKYLTAGHAQDRTPAESKFAQRWCRALQTEGGEDGILSFSELWAVLDQVDAVRPTNGVFGKDAEGDFAFLKKNGCAQAPPPPSDPEFAACSSARRQNTPEAWEYYLDTYPKGRCADEARDERAWLLAKRRDNPTAYQMYLDIYPLGRHAKEVQKKPELPDNMALIPGGTFTMGSTEGQDDEKHTHSVTVSDFYLGKYEVTVAEFRAFILDKGNYITHAEKEDSSYAYNGTKWGWVRGVNWRHDYEGKPAPNDHPVVHVSWNDAVAYCAWLTQKSGLTYRLPTEAEWEYAAGNGATHSKYSWGNDVPSGKKGGSVADDSGAAQFGWTKSETNIFLGYNDGFVAAAPVGSFEANNLGLNDMSGNVWEWCNDWYGSDYYKKSPTKNPGGPAAGSVRVLRGGSWGSYPQNCRVADRFYYSPTDRGSSIGFRLARTK